MKIEGHEKVRRMFFEFFSWFRILTPISSEYIIYQWNSSYMCYLDIYVFCFRVARFQINKPEISEE